MGWKQYVRAMEADERRRQRESARRYRELQREMKQQDKAAALEHAAGQVARYETYIELLTSVHADCGPQWDWQSIAQTPPPVAPQRRSVREDAAALELSRYQPGFFARLFGGAAVRRQLEATVSVARANDEQEFATAVAQYSQQLAIWEHRVALAPGVLRLQLEACRAALSHALAFAEVESFKSSVALSSIVDGVGTMTCTMNDPDLVPREELKQTASGKLSTKEMAAGKYWLLYQDHVCSCAIGLARETFAVLPLRRLIVNMFVRQLNTATGHIEPVCVLAVHFTQEALSRLRFDSIDPSDSMRNFNHRMKFKKTAGFEPVESSSADEQWVSA